jgi:hypothetical protein
MKTKSVTIVTMVGVLLMISGPILAHHGMAAFDMENLTTVKGTVTNFEFINPHVLIYVDAVGPKGEAQHWLAENQSNNHLSRMGWTRTTLKAGDQVTIVAHRARNGGFTLELQCKECSVLDSQGKLVVPDAPE